MGLGVRFHAAWHSSLVQQLNSSSRAVTDCRAEWLPPDDVSHIVFSTNKGGGGIWGVGELGEWYLNHLPSTIHSVSNPRLSISLKIPSWHFPLYFASFRPLFVTIRVAFGRVEMAVDHMRGPSIEGGEGEDGSRD